jgi:hypothetical protein
VSQGGFLPWIGPRYEEGVDGVRILILGEAHYVGDAVDNHPELTTQIIEDCHTGNRKLPYFTKLTRLLQRGLDIEDIWPRVAFYNFIQEPVLGGARTRPTQDQWCEGRAPYQRRLTELEPDLVIATGKDLWERLPRRGMVEQEGNDSGGVATLRPNGARSPLTGFIHHPSSGGFSYGRWLPIVKALHAKAAASTSMS